MGCNSATRLTTAILTSLVAIEHQSTTMSELPLARKFDDPLLTAKDERHAWVSLKGLETYGSTLGLCAILRANTAT